MTQPASKTYIQLPEPMHEEPREPSLSKLSVGVLLTGALRAVLLTGLAASCKPSEPAASTTAAPPQVVAAAEEARDVVLITLDTLRHDALGFAAGPWATPTPHLESLAQTGRRFSFAFAHNTVTLPSHTNMLTGLYPYQHGVRENTGFTLGPEIPTAATLFQAAGFATGAFVSALTLDSRYGLDRGFELYDDRVEGVGEAGLFRVAERRGDTVTERALEWWQQHSQQRRFLWLHLFDPHAPYDPPAPWAERFQERPYRGEVAAVDAFLGALIEEFEDAAKKPLVVITADHGEALGEHGERTHGVFAYQSTLKVPLILWGPGVAGGIDDRLARHVDILPTLLSAAGLSDVDGLPGASLLRAAPEETSSYFECLGPALERGWAPLRGLVAGRYKLIDLPLPELYDLASDPAESNNLVSRERRLFHQLRDQLPSESVWPPVQGTVTAEEQARLRSLGYLADSASARSSYGPEDDPKNLISLDATIHFFSEEFSAGNFAVAEKYARELISKRPSMPVGHTQLAQALLGQGRRPEAVEAMEQARRLGAASPGLIRQLALTLAEIGRAPEALPWLESLAESGDLDAESVYGQVLQESGHTAKARAVLLAVVEREPGHGASWQRLSAVALDAGRAAEAEDYARRALDIDAFQARSWNNLGVALLLQKRPDDAFESWQRALELDNQAWDTLYNLGMQAARFGRLELAVDSLRRYVAEAPAEQYAEDLPKARSVLGQLASKKRI